MYKCNFLLLPFNWRGVRGMYHLSAKIISRGKGGAVEAAAYRSGSTMTGSVVKAAAYRSGERLATPDEQGKEAVHDYSRKSDVLFTEILAPDNAPEWVHERETLWNRVEASEKRKDAQLAREVEVALPRELSLDECKELIRAFVGEQFTSKGMVADVAIHSHKATDGGEQGNKTLAIESIAWEPLMKMARE
jgi:hypothetical protein